MEIENSLDYLKLGASLYIPAVHKDLPSVALGLKYPALKSLIVDLEDSVGEDEVPYAYHNLERLLAILGSAGSSRPLLFVRPRHCAGFAELLKLKYIERVNGFVLPKFNPENMESYLRLSPPDKYLMPILEKNVFEPGEIEKIRDFLLPRRQHILSIRIGANDLLGSLNLRRDCQTVAYDIGLLQHVITNIVLRFRPHGINVSAPVYECFGKPHWHTLQRETRLDLINGLFGKTIVHPSQISVVEEVYKASRADAEAASRLLSPYSSAVFQINGQMHEKATHLGWARYIMERARLYGVQE